jgi:hypothetical protein
LIRQYEAGKGSSGFVAGLPFAREKDMRKHRLDRQREPDFGVGLPLGLIAILMLGITAYLVALDTQIPPPSTAVYFPAGDLPAR